MRPYVTDTAGFYWQQQNPNRESHPAFPELQTQPVLTPADEHHN